MKQWACTIERTELGYLVAHLLELIFIHGFAMVGKGRFHMHDYTTHLLLR